MQEEKRIENREREREKRQRKERRRIGKGYKGRDESPYRVLLTHPLRIKHDTISAPNRQRYEYYWVAIPAISVHRQSRSQHTLRGLKPNITNSTKVANLVGT